MTTSHDIDADRDLVITREYNVPREKLYRCWTEPELLKQWFAPKPWGVSKVVQDLRPGGRSLIVMTDPEGNEFPNDGVYLEAVPNEKIVFTDAFREGWKPSPKAMFTGTILFEDLGGGRSRYVAIARHWTAEDCKAHADMGFEAGWGLCADQMAELAKTL